MKNEIVCGMEGSMTAIARRARTMRTQILALAVLMSAPAVQASTIPLNAEAWRETVQARFDPAVQETIVASRVTPSLCFVLSLPQEWRSNTSGDKTSFKAASFEAELEVSLRSAHELQNLPQPDLASRDAAFLQQDYEGLLGRPAQSVSLTSPTPGATRWSATWIDANLPSASRAMTVEALIVPLSNEWVLELSLTDLETREAYNALIQKVLAGLKVRGGAACRG
jgi:hypothetical protein